MDLSHKEKVAIYKKELAKKGFSKSKIKNLCDPPILRLFWKLGWEVPPAAFLPIIIYFLFLSIFFGFFYGWIMWLMIWENNGMPASRAVTASLVAGFLYGFI
ncbi:MAG: DUF6404 family protein, partial [Pseudomonadota bacterium]